MSMYYCRYCCGFFQTFLQGFSWSFFEWWVMIFKEIFTIVLLFSFLDSIYFCRKILYGSLLNSSKIFKLLQNLKNCIRNSSKNFSRGIFKSFSKILQGILRNLLRVSSKIPLVPYLRNFGNFVQIFSTDLFRYICWNPSKSLSSNFSLEKLLEPLQQVFFF